MTKSAVDTTLRGSILAWEEARSSWGAVVEESLTVAANTIVKRAIPLYNTRYKWVETWRSRHKYVVSWSVHLMTQDHLVVAVTGPKGSHQVNLPWVILGRPVREQAKLWREESWETFYWSLRSDAWNAKSQLNKLEREVKPLLSRLAIYENRFNALNNSLPKEFQL